MKILALCICLLALAGCSMFHKQDPKVAALTCPATGLVPGSSSFPVIEGNKAHSGPADVAALGHTQSITGDCKFKKGEVEVNLTLNFTGQKGAKGAKLTEQVFPYFVAVVSPNDEILQRQVFSTTVDFDNATGAGTSSEDHRIHVPMKDFSASGSYRIAAGFTLTPQQATYNKDNNAN
jgi:hypothetical protein